MRVLITGGAGFIGSHLAETLLWRGDEVVVLDDLSSGSLRNLEYVQNLAGFTFVEGTVLDQGLVDGLVGSTDAVVHLASEFTEPVSPGRLRVNAQGTVNVLAAAANLARRTVMVPSPDWTSAVGSAAEEQLAVNMANSGGFPVSVVRLANIVGPRETADHQTLLYRFVSSALKGEDLVLRGTGKETAAFCYVEDALQGLISVLEHDSGGHIFTLGSDEEITTFELAHLAIEVAESPVSLRLEEPGDPEELFSPVPDISDARQILNYEPRWSVVDAANALVAYAFEQPIPAPLGRVERRKIIRLEEPEVVAAPVVEEVLLPEVEAEVVMLPLRRRVNDPVPAGVAHPSISVVVPVYNERHLIAECVRRIRSQECVGELIVVDDGSTDGTRAELQKVSDFIDRVIYLPRNRGKGAALREGVRFVTGDIIVFQDSDLELDPADISRLAAPILSGEADIVTGTRMHEGNKRLVSARQWLANSAVTRLASVLYRTDLTDMATAARAMSKNTWDALHVESDRFGIEAELHAKCSRLNVKIMEIPIIFRPRTKAEGKKIRWTDGIVAGRTLLRYRMWRPVGEGARRLAAPTPPPMSVYKPKHRLAEPIVLSFGPERNTPAPWEPARVGLSVARTASSAG